MIDSQPAPTQFVPITDAEAVDALFDRSRREPVLIFKHDPWCGISRRVEKELRRLGGTLPTIDVARDRSISLGLAERTGVQHESPQVLLLRNGEAIWSASHRDVTSDKVTQALEATTPKRPG